jgi:hypothetical protein
MIKNNEIALIINTVDEKRKAINDSRSIRTSAWQARVTMYTTSGVRKPRLRASRIVVSWWFIRFRHCTQQLN